MTRSVLIIGGTRFVGRLLAWRLLARGDRVTLLNRGTLEDPFGDRVERLRGDRTTADFARLIAGRRWDCAVDFAAYEARDVLSAMQLDVGHYVFISTGQVYLVRSDAPVPSREEDYDGPTKPRPPSEEDLGDWEYGMGKRACEDALIARPDFPSTRLRIPVVNGPRDYYRRIERYVRTIYSGGAIEAKHLDRRIRHADALEVARTIDVMLGDPRFIGGAFNQAQDETPTLREFLMMMMDSLRLEVPLIEADVGTDVSPFSGKWMSFLDPSRIRAMGIDHAPLSVTLPRTLGHILGELRTSAKTLKARAWPPVLLF